MYPRGDTKASLSHAPRRTAALLAGQAIHRPAICARVVASGSPLLCFICASMGISVGLAGCGDSGRIDPVIASEESPGVLTVGTTCASDVEARLVESSLEVRIDEFGGQPIDGDCRGAVVFDLASPMGTRSLVVNEQTWVALVGCDFEGWAPAEASQGCPTP